MTPTTRRRLARVLGLLLVLLALGIVVGIRRPATPTSTAGTPSGTSSGTPIGTPASGPTLERALEVVADGGAGLPRDRWDPAYLAERIGTDPRMHLTWVRERSVWIPYRGVLRGPAGVLQDGQGNSLDRALLLAAMLGHAGHEVRLAHGEMSADQASRLLPALIARRRRAAAEPDTGASDAGWRAELIGLTQAYDFEAARLMATIAARMDTVTRIMRTLDARTEQQGERLDEALGAGRSAKEPKRIQGVLADLRDHWWVQYRTPEGWADLDILGDASGRTDLTADRTATAETIDSALSHTVTVRLVTERFVDGSLRETKALEHGFRPLDVLGKSITLQIVPDRWRPEEVEHAGDPRAALRAALLEQESWYASLSLGKEVVTQIVLQRSGKTESAVGGGPFGGLGKGIAGALGPKSPGELSAAWIEYEVRRPGASPAVTRRQLFDVVGPAARAAGAPITLQLDDARRLDRSLAFLRSTEILPLAGGVAAEYLTHLTAQALQANGELLRMPAPPAGSSPTELAELIDRRGALPVSPLYALAAVRLPAGPAQDAYLDRPNILSLHDHLVARKEGIARLRTTDIVSNEVEVGLDAENPAEVRRRQGIRDTNAEALVFGAPMPESSVALASVKSGRWLTIRSTGDRALDSLPPDIRQRMREDLRAGYAVVVPADAASGWWRTDPVTGHTLGVSSTGWGQSAIEKVAIFFGAVAVGWTLEYLLCSGSLYVPGLSYQSAGAAVPTDWLVARADATTVDKDACIWEAWKAGIMAGAFHLVSTVWWMLAKQFPALKFFERPMFSTGDVDPDFPPIFGGPPPPPPPPPQEKCQNGGGGGGGAAPGAAEGAPPKPGPTEPAPPKPAPAEPEAAPPTGTAPEGQPQPEPAPQTSEASPVESPMPQPRGGGGPSHLNEELTPVEPGEMQATVQRATEASNAARPQLDPARAKVQDARAALKAAEADYAAADAAAEADKNSIKAAVDANAALERLGDARNALAAAEQEVAGLEQTLAREAYAKRLQPLNDALYQARTQYQEVAQRFNQAIQSGEADFQGSQYKEWKAAFDRYNQALKDYGNGYWNKQPSPAPSGGSPVPGGPGQTQPLTPQPGGPGQTQPLPQTPKGPGQTQPLGNPQPSGPAPAAPSGGKSGSPTLGNAKTCAGGPPPGSPPPGTPPPGQASPQTAAPAGKAPSGTGPFQGDPENREWLRQNWDPDPFEAHEAARTMGDPVIYDNADQAALARYDQARAQGMDDKAARQESWDAWWSSVQSQRQERGVYMLKDVPFFQWVGYSPHVNPDAQVLIGSSAAAGNP